MDVCDPDFSLFNCTDQYGNPRYVQDYVCRGDSPTVAASRCIDRFIFIAAVNESTAGADTLGRH